MINSNLDVAKHTYFLQAEWSGIETETMYVQKFDRTSCMTSNLVQKGEGETANCYRQECIRKSIYITVYKYALCCEMASSYLHQPNHSYVNFMFHLHSDVIHTIVVANVRY